MGPPERWILAWPAALGYTGFLLVALGFRDVQRQTTWLLILAGAWVLCLGGSLRVNGVDSGFPLPHAWLVKIPVLSMLRRPDRLLVLVQLAFAVLCAYGWRGFAQRLSSRRTSAAAFATCAAAVCLEFGGAPLASFSSPCSPHYAELASRSDVASLLVLPPSSVYGPRAGIHNLCQTVHGKKMTGGYITSLAITPALFKEALAWIRSFADLADPDDPMLRERVERKGIDRVVLHKRISISRRELKTDRPLRWEPFVAIKEPLLAVRQTGPVVPAPANPDAVEAAVEALRQRFGAPVHEDDQIVVFRVGRSHD